MNLDLLSRDSEQITLRERDTMIRDVLASVKSTRIIVRDGATKKPLFEPRHNKTVLAGATFTAMRTFEGITPRIWTPTYNTDLKLENSVNEPFTGNFREGEFVCLYCVGRNGTGVIGSQINEIDYASRIEPEYLVPFRYVNASTDLTSVEREKYFGRQVGKNKIAYYAKAFESEPIFRQQYLDGTQIDENIYASQRAKNEKVQSYVELSLKINKLDCREWYTSTSKLADAKINQISLLIGWKKEINGLIYYQDLRPYSVLNFATELLMDETKTFDIIYQLFY